MGGYDCSLRTCDTDCSGHGYCYNGTCYCRPGWTGMDCATATCMNACNYHGTCINMTCQCDEGWTYLDCSQRACPDDCSGNGMCDGWKGECHCYGGYAGDNCASRCPGVGGQKCSGHGKCNNGTCFCSPGWSGYDCNSRPCLYDCSNHGYCNNGTCLCYPGYRGKDCSLSTTPVPCQCAIRCVRGCLDQCTRVYEAQGPQQSHECYTKCTHKCVPQCLAGGVPEEVQTDKIMGF